MADAWDSEVFTAVMQFHGPKQLGREEITVTGARAFVQRLKEIARQWPAIQRLTSERRDICACGKTKDFRDETCFHCTADRFARMAEQETRGFYESEMDARVTR